MTGVPYTGAVKAVKLGGASDTGAGAACPRGSALEPPPVLAPALTPAGLSGATGVGAGVEMLAMGCILTAASRMDPRGSELAAAPIVPARRQASALMASQTALLILQVNAQSLQQCHQDSCTCKCLSPVP